jgi:hypothetical protein
MALAPFPDKNLEAAVREQVFANAAPIGRRPPMTQGWLAIGDDTISSRH